MAAEKKQRVNLYYPTKLSYFRTLEVTFHYRDTQLEVGEKLHIHSKDKKLSKYLFNVGLLSVTLAQTLITLHVSRSRAAS